jgi:hypothetical protein
MKKDNAFSTQGRHEEEKASQRSSRSRHLNTLYIQCHTAKRELRKDNAFSTLGWQI